MRLLRHDEDTRTRTYDTDELSNRTEGIRPLDLLHSENRKQNKAKQIRPVKLKLYKVFRKPC